MCPEYSGFEQRVPRLARFGRQIGAVEDRAVAPVVGDEVLLAVELPQLLEPVRHLVPVRQAGRVDLLDQPLFDVELQPARVGVEDVGLAAGHHLGQDIGVGRADLEGHVDVGIGVLEIDPEVLGIEAGPVEDRETATPLGGGRDTRAPGEEGQHRDDGKDRPRVLSRFHRRNLLRTR